MTNFVGDHIVKIDSKGRISFPSSFLKQMPFESSENFRCPNAEPQERSCLNRGPASDHDLAA